MLRFWRKQTGKKDQEVKRCNIDNNSSIVEFFYNIIPGVVFIFLLQIFNVIDLRYFIKDSTLVIFVYIVLGLLLGFVFQGITIFLRHTIKWNERAYRRVIDKSALYKIVADSFDSKISVRSDSTLLFYLMDSKLRGQYRAFLPTHFSSLFAFWSNILCALVSIIFVLVLKYRFSLLPKSELISYVSILLGLAIISWLFADKFLKSFYDSILNVYYAAHVQKVERKKATKSRRSS